MFKRILIFGIICITLSHGAELNSNEEEARNFLKQASDVLFKLLDDNAEHAFSNNSHITYDVREETRKYSTVLKKTVDDAKKFDYTNFKDDELKYAFEELIKVAGEQVVGPEEYLHIYDAFEELENVTTHRIVGEYGNPEKKVAIARTYDEVFERSNDPEELEYYWKKLRELTSDWAVKNLDIMLKGLKDAASMSGMSPLEFWLNGLNLTDMENFVTETQPAYMELHAFIRKQLLEKFGESLIDADGLIPDHLMEAVDFKIATNQSVIEELFPHRDLPMMDAIIAEKYKSRDLYEIADNFYESLGFEKFPATLWGDRFRQGYYYNDEYGVYDYDGSKEIDESKNVGGHYDYNDHEEEHSDENMDAEIDEDDDMDGEKCMSRLHYWTPKVYLEYCEQMNYTDFLEAYVDMGCLYYAKEMKDLPAYYFNIPHNLQFAIGHAVLLSVSSYHNLKAIGMIPKDKEITPEVELNRLFRMAIPSLIHIRVNYIQAKIMSELLTGKVKIDNLNEYYWKQMAKYLGVGPPKDHTTKLLDIDEQFFQDMYDNYMSGTLTAEMLSYQIHKKLCELSGNFPEKPLHMCDISGSKEAGEALRKMMRLGTTKPFHDVLAILFPDNPSVRIEGFLQYYKPVLNLLAEKNKEAGIKLGWETAKSR